MLAFRLYSNYTVSHPSSQLLNEYHVINRAESPLDAAQCEPFSKIVNQPQRDWRGARQCVRSRPGAPRRIATRHNYCEPGFNNNATRGLVRTAEDGKKGESSVFFCGLDGCDDRRVLCNRIK